MGLRLVSVVGLVAFLALAWALSENRRAISWRIVAWGLALQFALALVILRAGFAEPIFNAVRAVIGVLTDATVAGAEFVFGPLADPGDAILAFHVLPVIILVSALSAMLYQLRIIQGVVHAMAWVMRRTLKTSGAETFGAALLVFLGIESVTALRGYISNMTRSELCVLMTAFMATIAGSVMVVYAAFGAEPGHLMTASLISAPAAILIAKMMVPETAIPETQEAGRIELPVETYNVVDAAAKGAGEGLKLALNVAAMLIAFIGLVYLLNLLAETLTGQPFTYYMGLLFLPFAWLMGVPMQDVSTLAGLLGTKTVLNEFLAYAELQALIAEGALEPRSVMVATYALCGFANPGSLGILIAGLSSLMPDRRSEIVQLGLKAFVGGTLAAFTTACVAGIIGNV